jgi:hypothetical protein
MAQLLENIGVLKKHLTMSPQFDFLKLGPFTKRAERKYIKSLIGSAQLSDIIEHVYDENAGTPIDEVKLLLEEAAAHYCLLIAIPFLELSISNLGFKKTTTTNSENADWKDMRDLKRYLLETANEAIDDAVEIMEDNATDFNSWKTSDLFTVFKKNIIRHTREFQKSFDINNSRKTFLSLQAPMYEVEEQYLLPMLGQCTLDFIKEVSIDEKVIRVQELSRLAVGALTVAKVAITGKFLFTSTSFQVRTDELPWEKSKLELSADALENLRADRQNAGQEFLKKIKTIVVANPSVFTCYQDVINKGLDSKIIIKKSHIHL